MSGNPPEMNASATYTYDGLGRMLTASDVAVRQYEYDLWGNIKRNDGVTLAYTDAARPHQATGFGGGGDIDHDENGNRTARLDGALPDQSYDYDWDDRVRRVTVNGSSAVEFGYDAAGQRTIERRGALAANGTLVNPEVTRFYSDVYQVNGATAFKYYVTGGMLVASRRATAPASLQVASASSGAVQVAGIWSGRPGLLVGLSPAAAATAAGGLAAGIGLVLLIPGRRRRLGLGWRVHPADAALVILPLLATSLPIPLWVRPAAAQCDPQPTPAATAVVPQDIHHYHLDHLGSPQTITTGDGTVLRQTRYHPYGAIRGRWLTSGDSEQDRREFTGYYSEPLSELEYAGARLYDPKLGTFLTQDPAGQFASPYAYGAWSPLNGTDPTGTFWFLPVAWLTSELFVTTAAIGFAAGFAAQSIQAAVNGASVGGSLNAGLEGGVAGAISAAIGLSILEPGLTSVVANVISEAAGQYVGPALFVSGLGQAGYGLSQGDFSGVIGLGVSIGIGFAIAQGANGAAGSGSGQTEGEGDLLRVADSQRVPRHSENLEGLDPRFRTKVEAMMTYLEDRGYDPHVPKGSGLRSAAEQAAKAAAGYSKIRSGGPHQFGMAADIVDTRWGWGEFAESPWLGTPAYENYWAHLRVGAEAQGLRWGGNFGNLGPYNLGWDPAHVEMPGWRQLVPYH